MYKFGHISEIAGFCDAPTEVIEIAKNYLRILDDVYGADRNVDLDDGGYVVILNDDDSFSLLNDIGLNVDELTVEHFEVVETSTGDWVDALVLLNNETGITILASCKQEQKTAKMPKGG